MFIQRVLNVAQQHPIEKKYVFSANNHWVFSTSYRQTTIKLDFLKPVRPFVPYFLIMEKKGLVMRIMAYHKKGTGLYFLFVPDKGII